VTTALLDQQWLIIGPYNLYSVGLGVRVALRMHLIFPFWHRLPIWICLLDIERRYVNAWNWWYCV